MRQRIRPQLKLPLSSALRWPVVLLLVLLAVWLARSSSVAVRFTGRSIVIAPVHGTLPPATAHVLRVIDGDTIELTDGQLVRYLGIDTPEVRRRVNGHWVMAPEPFGLEASAANRELVEGKTVRCEYDVQTHDRYGRLLAYVYVGETMINEELLRRGMARILMIAPNGRYAERFRSLAAEARHANRGLWNDR